MEKQNISIQNNSKSEPADIPIDISKLSTFFYFKLICQISKGTPPFSLLKVLAAPLGSIIIVATTAFNIGAHREAQNYSKDQSRPSAIESAAEHVTSETVISTTEKNYKNEGFKLENENYKTKNIELQKEIDSLRESLNKKPSYSTCYDYKTEYNNLKKEKDDIDSKIQFLLNPNSYRTREQIAQNMFYGIEQMNTFVKQAAEYRKTADDKQNQILAIQELRKACE